MHYHLIIGNQAYSSWSLRGWLLLKPFDIEFSEAGMQEDWVMEFNEFDRE